MSKNSYESSCCQRSMHAFFLICMWLFLQDTRMTSGEIVAKNSGIQHIERHDVGMVFYVEIKNEGKHSCAINVRMIKCCETICPSDVECEHMQLVGGEMGIVVPKASKNLTLVWPTLYLHNRIGECLIAIGYTTKNNQTGEVHQKVKFDTTVSSRIVRPILQGYYGTTDVRKCSTADLDTLDDCRPVNCHVKYNGKRNFFNRRQQRCQAVPICIADTTKELPDVAYVPASNTCRDLENAVNEMEVRTLSQGIAEVAWRSEPLPYLAIAGILGILVVLFCCAMAYVVRGQVSSPPLPGDGSDCSKNQVVQSSCQLTSARSHATSSSNKPYKRFYRGNIISDTSCSVNRVIQY